MLTSNNFSSACFQFFIPPNAWGKKKNIWEELRLKGSPLKPKISLSVFLIKSGPITARPWSYRCNRQVAYWKFWPSLWPQGKYRKPIAHVLTWPVLIVCALFGLWNQPAFGERSATLRGKPVSSLTYVTFFILERLILKRHIIMKYVRA